MQTVVLGMHRSGSSLLASILIDLGISMGKKLLRPSSSNPLGHFEDLEFLHLNQRILRQAKGRWNRPPSPKAILAQSQSVTPTITKLVSARRGKWGWKDPRTCLTILLYAPHLVNPRYIEIMRDKSAVMRSLTKRQKGGRYGALYDEYLRRTKLFLSGVESLRVTYEMLTDKRTSRSVVNRINKYVDGNGNIEKAIGRIK